MITLSQKGEFAPLLQRRLGMVDIGARGGLLPHWEPMAPWLDVLAFEVDSAEAARLRNTLASLGARVQVKPQAVWETCGIQTLYVTRNPALSSLFEPRRPFLSQFPNQTRFDIVARVEVETVTLDETLSDIR